jgi:hypothetical protein
MKWNHFCSRTFLMQWHPWRLRLPLPCAFFYPVANIQKKKIIFHSFSVTLFTMARTSPFFILLQINYYRTSNIHNKQHHSQHTLLRLDTGASVITTVPGMFYLPPWDWCIYIYTDVHFFYQLIIIKAGGAESLGQTGVSVMWRFEDCLW